MNRKENSPSSNDPKSSATGSSSDSTQAPNPSPDTSSRLIAEFWKRMSAMFGHTWVSQYGASPEGVARETWLAVIGDLSPRQIGSGLDALKSSAMEWPPSAPRFRAMCFPFPSIREVRIEIERRNGTDCDFSAYVYSMMNRIAYAEGTVSTRERLLREAYNDLKTYVLDGFQIPAQAPRIEGPK